MLEHLLGNQVFLGIGSATIFGGVLYLARQAPARAWHYVKAAFSVNIEARSTDETFYWLVKWLAAHPYSQKARRLRLSRISDQGDDVPAPAATTSSRAAPKFLLSPGNGLHFFLFNGTPVVLSRQKDDNAKGDGYRERETLSLTVFARNRRVLLEIINAAYEIASNGAADRIPVYFFDYDSWCQSTTQRKRPMESVVLQQGVSDAIASDLGRFLEARSWYEERGVPWRRGYLFYGPPGTGKSSLVAALASKFDMGVAIMSLANFVSDEAVIKAMRRQPERTLLLIEDVDAAIARDNKEGKVSFSAVLNALDGVGAPEGRVVVMTTNHREKLDPALIRPGRIDLQVEIGNATTEQAARMFTRYFHSDGAAFGAAACGLAPARLQELLMSAASADEAVESVLAEVKPPEKRTA